MIHDEKKPCYIGYIVKYTDRGVQHDHPQRQLFCFCIFEITSLIPSYQGKSSNFVQQRFMLSIMLFAKMYTFLLLTGE